MKPHRTVLLVLICIVSLAAACRTVPRPTQITDPSPLLDKELLYLGTAEGRPLLLDPGGESKLYALGSEYAATLSRAEMFSVVLLIKNPGDGSILLSTKVPPVARNVPVVAAADQKQAAQMYSPALFDRFMFSRRLADYAIDSYTIRSTKILSSGPYAATVEVVADLSPVRDAFSQVRSRWGQPAADGWVRERRLVFTLYGYGGQYCVYHPDWMNRIFAEGAPPVDQTPPETLYKPIVYESIWQALDEGKDVEQVIWEDDTYSFISTTKLTGAFGRQHYTMAIHRVRRSSGARLALIDGLQHSWQARPLGLHGRTLYLQIAEAAPFSEGYAGPVASLDLETGEYTVLLTEQTAVLGKVSDKVYVAKLVNPDSADAGGVYSLDVATTELKRVSDLPGPSFSTAYEYASLMWSDKAGKLFVYWPNPVAGEGQYLLYSVDPVSGLIAPVR